MTGGIQERSISPGRSGRENDSRMFDGIVKYNNKGKDNYMHVISEGRREEKTRGTIDILERNWSTARCRTLRKVSHRGRTDS